MSDSVSPRNALSPAGGGNGNCASGKLVQEWGDAKSTRDALLQITKELTRQRAVLVDAICAHLHASHLDGVQHIRVPDSTTLFTVQMHVSRSSKTLSNIALDDLFNVRAPAVRERISAGDSPAETPAKKKRSPKAPTSPRAQAAAVLAAAVHGELDAALTRTSTTLKWKDEPSTGEQRTLNTRKRKTPETKVRWGDAAKQPAAFLAQCVQFRELAQVQAEARRDTKAAREHFAGVCATMSAASSPVAPPTEPDHAPAPLSQPPAIKHEPSPSPLQQRDREDQGEAFSDTAEEEECDSETCRRMEDGQDPAVAQNSIPFSEKSEERRKSLPRSRWPDVLQSTLAAFTRDMAVPQHVRVPQAIALHWWDQDSTFRQPLLQDLKCAVRDAREIKRVTTYTASDGSSISVSTSAVSASDQVSRSSARSGPIDDEAEEDSVMPDDEQSESTCSASDF